MCYTTGSCYAFSIGLYEGAVDTHEYVLADRSVYLSACQREQTGHSSLMGRSCRSKPRSCRCRCCCDCCGFIVWVLKEARGSLLVAPAKPGRLALVTDIIRGTLQMLPASVVVASEDGLLKPWSPTICNLSVVTQEATRFCSLSAPTLFWCCLILLDSACQVYFCCRLPLSLCPTQETYSLPVGKKLLCFKFLMEIVY